MLSFIISNALIVANAAMGVPPVTPAQLTADLQYSKSIAQAQELTITGSPQVVSRDAITIELAPATQNRVSRPQIGSQSLPASNSALVGSAFKYLGSGMDCTALVENALRDLGYSVPDLGPMGFGMFGSTFGDPSQVQPGDIMMRGGHVAIYVGDGLAVQGGFNGSVAIVSDSPSRYAVFVRLGQ
jgi:cell wall-associated NlpC family hydrolase